MNKYEILNKVLNEHLNKRVNKLESNYSTHTSNLKGCLNIIEEMKTIVSVLNAHNDPSLNNLINNDLNKSYTSTTSKGNFDKSKSSVKGARVKTPYKSNTQKNLLLKSTEKNKTKIVNGKNSKNDSMSNASSLLKSNKKTLTNTKSSTNIKKPSINDRGVSTDNNKLKKTLSKLPLNSDISPTHKKGKFSKSNTPLNNSPRIHRQTSLTKLKMTNGLTSKNEDFPNAREKNNRDSISSTSGLNSNRNSALNLKIKSRALNSINPSSSNAFASEKAEKVEKVEKIEKKHKMDELEKDFNVSKIIQVDGGLHDDSLINNKDDLLINCDDGELEMLTKQMHMHMHMNSEHMVTLNRNPQNQIKLEYEEILDDKWCSFTKYLNLYDLSKVLTLNKKFGRYTINKLITNFEEEIQIFEQKLSQYESLPKLSDVKESDTIIFSRGTNKAVEILNDNLYNRIFTDPVVPSDDILLVYMIYFQIINHNIIIMFNKDRQRKNFWEETCKYFTNDSNGKTGKFNLILNRKFNIKQFEEFR